MRKKLIIVMFALILYICGCDRRQEKTIEESVINYNISESVAEPEQKLQGKAYRKITIDDIRKMSEKHESLSLEDFSPFMDIVSDFSEGKSIWKQLRFEYNGDIYYLRVIASDKGMVQAANKDALDAAVVFKEEFLQLRGVDEYSYPGACADIRSGNLDHILAGNIEIEDYLICEIPCYLKYSDFKYWLGTRGGVIFFPVDESEYTLTPNNSGIFAIYDKDFPLHGGIEIRENGELERYENIQAIYEPLKEGDILIKREMAQLHENGYMWYIARIAKEDSTIEYCVYLNHELYSEEDFFCITESIQMKAHAIY